VEAYHKPELTTQTTTDKKYYLGGKPIPVTITAKYYFGQPVTNAKVTYKVRYESHVYFDAASTEASDSGTELPTNRDASL